MLLVLLSHYQSKDQQLLPQSNQKDLRNLQAATEPNTVATVNAVSDKGSFINVCNLCVVAATANPIAAPPKNTITKCSVSLIK